MDGSLMTQFLTIFERILDKMVSITLGRGNRNDLLKFLPIKYSINNLEENTRKAHLCENIQSLKISTFLKFQNSQLKVIRAYHLVESKSIN